MMRSAPCRGITEHQDPSYTSLAQLVEPPSPKRVVAGSSPAAGAILLDLHWSSCITDVDARCRHIGGVRTLSLCARISIAASTFRNPPGGTRGGFRVYGPMAECYAADCNPAHSG